MKTVERGAALLDEKVPGWERKINLDELDLSSCSACILGQIYLDAHPRIRHTVTAYEREMQELGIKPAAAPALGFSTWGTGSFCDLTAAWKRLIRKRLA